MNGTVLGHWDQCLNEYGVDPTCAGAREWASMCKTRPRHIETPSGYVRACRRLDPSLQHDWRLIVAGFRRVPPREWVLGDRVDGRPPRRLADFAAWWWKTQPRKWAVGSPYNADPEIAVTLWLAGPSVQRAASGLPADRWNLLVSRDRGTDELRVSKRALRWVPEMARCARRTSAGRWALDVRTARALGALDPELQRAALATVRLDEGRTVVRIRDIDWGCVARVRDEMARDQAGRVRAAWALDPDRLQSSGVPTLRFAKLAEAAGKLREDDARAIAQKDYHHFRKGTPLSAWLSPAYPNVPLHIAVRLCRGESPAQISGGLTRREAHEWLMSGATMDPAVWLVRGLPEARRLCVNGIAVARWLLDLHRRGGWGGLVRERTMRGPGGRIVRFQYISRLDEVRDEDLVGEGGSGVDAVFRRAAERYAGKYEEVFEEDHTVLHEPPRWDLGSHVRVLSTPADLVREGREMNHCVAGYIPAVRSGQSVILAIEMCGHRSTVELSPDGSEVRQHFAEYNQQPHELCVRVLDRFLRRNRLAQYSQC